LQKIVINLESDILSSGNTVHWIKPPEYTFVLMYVKESRNDFCRHRSWTCCVPRS